MQRMVADCVLMVVLPVMATQNNDGKSTCECGSLGADRKQDQKPAWTCVAVHPHAPNLPADRPCRTHGTVKIPRIFRIREGKTADRHTPAIYWER